MQRVLRKTTLITIVFFISFILVASGGIAYQRLFTNTPQVNECANPDLRSCKDISPAVDQPLTPDPQLNNQQRFLAAIAYNLPIIPQPGTFEYILLRAYGAVFVNQEPEIQLPQKVILANEQETEEFQSTLMMTKVDGINGCYLQQPAAAALNKVRSLINIPLKSGYGSGDCTRTFATNLRFWRKYANNQTLEKVRQGRETAILGIVAPPGTSQHLWGLAIDLRAYSPQQRQALNQNGWFQTVEKDLPHWTYIGLPQEDLPLFGFRKKVIRGVTYWITPI
ncbi:MAG: D-alanyl-D-alanine carboxypeptidase family protein [Goleter apudmare HA4340-LM2]|jgi:LAS superfamily LD-carboxypeptidase LdcB|nr:D-alanyl-D-alanine carboxypeptidase family protein [Goleter apudmare HA4340-LM2]